MIFNEVKTFFRQKKKQWQTRKRVNGFKKRIQRLEESRKKMREISH